MCGIVGLIDQVAGHVPPALLTALNDAMIARGPDGAGTFVDGPVGMAMRRLAIIDLSTGNQPFFCRGGRVVAFQNGEIYNYRQLKRILLGRGCVFRSDSDTEVLAHGFDEWGMEGLLERIDGMYAFAILDRDARQLHLARDRFGEKPLFYAAGPGRFAYASSLLVVAALPWVSGDIDLRALDRYLALHYVPGDSTVLSQVKRVLPGERLVVPLDDPKPIRHRYYRPELGLEQPLPDAHLAEVIEGAVESRLVADVPVGVFLSGGLDSSIVAAIAARKQPQIATFSMGFASPEHDESAFAKAVSTAAGTTHHHFLFDEHAFKSLLPRVADALDEPIGDQALLPVYWLCQEARRHVTVVLAGEGADEVFGGYGYYRAAGNANEGRGLPRVVENAIPLSPSGFPLLTDAESRRMLLGVDASQVDRWEQDVMAWLGTDVPPLQRASAADVATWLPDDLLVKFDRMAMAHSLEGRAPFLDPLVVEAGLRLPAQDRMTDTATKVALRRLAGRWLPEDILRRPKQGFVLPMAAWLGQWFADHGSVSEYCRDREVQGLQMPAAAALIDASLVHGVTRERLLFALVLLFEWYRSLTERRRTLRIQVERSLDDGPPAGAGVVFPESFAVIHA